MCFVLYASTEKLGFFHIDDPAYVENNALIRDLSLDHIKKILTKPYFANYSPLHILSYSLDYKIAGLSASAFHRSSIIWGALVAGLVYLLSFQFTRRFDISLFAGLLFAAHPAHVEAITWISSRKDLVAAAFAIPCMITYILYRRKTRWYRLWYMLSLLLFILAEACKQSVVILPAVFFLYDLLVENRRNWQLITDKIPFIIVGTAFAYYVYRIQPSTRHLFDPFIFGHSMAYSLWLLTGLGDYVLYRARPGDETRVFIKTMIIMLPIFAVIIPFLIWKYIKPAWSTLYYWILLALVPPLILNFIHPVADRYLFYPSVAFCILLAWIIFATFQRIPVWGRKGAVTVLVIVLAIWAHSTYAYISEWHAPRSVWYAASRKSKDFYTFMYLGNHYQDKANALHDGTINEEDLREIASVLWRDKDRVNRLIQEWKTEKMGANEVINFRNYLLELAMDQFDVAVEKKGTLVQPNLFFRRGKIQMDLGNFDAAELEFRMAYRQAQIHTYEPIRQEITVRSHYALGLVEWHRKDYPAARDFIQMAYEEQLAAKGNWIPDIERQLQRIKRLSEKK